MENKLQRNEHDKVVAGVASGLADYFEIDTTWIRIAFVVAVFAGFSGILAYIVLWISVPAKPFLPFNTGYNPYDTDYRVHQQSEFANSDNNFDTMNAPASPYLKPKSEGNGKLIIGLIFIAFGGLFLLKEFDIIPFWFNFRKLWPLVFIIPGIIMIYKASESDTVKTPVKPTPENDMDKKAHIDTDSQSI